MGSVAEEGGKGVDGAPARTVATLGWAGLAIKTRPGLTPPVINESNTSQSGVEKIREFQVRAENKHFIIREPG